MDIINTEDIDTNLNLPNLGPTVEQYQSNAYFFLHELLLKY